MKTFGLNDKFFMHQLIFVTQCSVVEFFITGERFVVITRQLQAAEVLSKLSTMNGKSSFVKDPLLVTKQLVITKQLKLYFNNSSRIPTQCFLASRVLFPSQWLKPAGFILY
jgi:hypothetical protein